MNITCNLAVGYMAKRGVSRKARFKAALALDRQTQDRWAERNEVTYTHLYMVLQKGRPSQTLIEKIDAYIDEVEKRMKSVAA